MARISLFFVSREIKRRKYVKGEGSGHQATVLASVERSSQLSIGFDNQQDARDLPKPGCYSWEKIQTW